MQISEMQEIEIDLWFSQGSTYTYLTMLRLDEIEGQARVRFNLRPFYLGMIFNDIGRFPFVEEPQKLAYMWRDIERRAANFGLSPVLPAPWPLRKSVEANRIAFVALKEDWGRRYVQASYREWMEGGNPAGEEPNISASLKAVGQDPDPVVKRAFADETHQALLAETDKARSLGIFGSPSLVVGTEVFWGDDRLEDAVSWALTNRD